LVQELNKYVKQITGTELPVICEGAGGDFRRVLVGPSDELSKVGIDKELFMYDNFVIRSGERFLAIAGRDGRTRKDIMSEEDQLRREQGDMYKPRSRDELKRLEGPYATVYGVWQFLEDYCDVRWFMPGKLGTVVPSRKTLQVPTNLDVQFEKNILAGGARHKVDEDWMLQWRQPGSLNIKSHGGHGWTDYVIKPDVYAAKHPEYFPFIDGRRQPELGRHVNPDGSVAWNSGLCTTNSDVRRITLEYLKKQLETHDGVEFNCPDWGTGKGYVCECAACTDKGSYEKYWAELGGVPSYLSQVDKDFVDQRVWEYNLWFAKKLYAWNPKKRFFLSAYQNTWRSLPGMKVS